MKNLYLIITALILIILGGQFEVPLGNVPFILSDFFVFFFALLLPWRLFIITVSSYLIIGAFGLPVLAGGAGGIKHLFGNTSGYLFGYLIGGASVSLIHPKLKSNISRLFLVFSGYYLLFILGVSWLKFSANITYSEALQGGFYPFIFSMHLKGLLAWLIYSFIKTKIYTSTKN